MGSAKEEFRARRKPPIVRVESPELDEIGGFAFLLKLSGQQVKEHLDERKSGSAEQRGDELAREVCRNLCDEHGSLIFDASDLEDIAECNSLSLDTLLALNNAINDINGFSKKAYDEKKVASEKTDSTPSASTSPLISE